MTFFILSGYVPWLVAAGGVALQAQIALLQRQRDPCPALAMRFDKGKDQFGTGQRRPRATVRRLTTVQCLHQILDQPQGRAHPWRFGVGRVEQTGMSVGINRLPAA